MIRHLFHFCVMLTLMPCEAGAEDRTMKLYTPEALKATGVLAYILPRFSLKTQIKVEQVTDRGQADIVLGESGRALFAGVGQVWHLQQVTNDPDGARFAAWLGGEVGKRTVLAFAPEDVPIFKPPGESAPEAVEISFDGDARLGHEVARAKCRRCHEIDDASRMTSIGSTPSFGILRSLPDWDARFAAFYLLNPHPAFTIIEEVTNPFPDNRPPPIVPIELSLDELEALLAYVSGMRAKDLGAPIRHQ